MTLYIVTVWEKSGKIRASTHSEVRAAVETYNQAIIDTHTTEYAYLSETWATFPNNG